MPRVKLAAVPMPLARAAFARWAGWRPERRRTEHAVDVMVAHSRVDDRESPPRFIPCVCDLCRHVGRLPVG